MGEEEPEYVAFWEDQGCIPRDAPIWHLCPAQGWVEIPEPSKILCNPNELLDDIFNKARNRVCKQHTWNKKPLNPRLKLAATLRHLDSGANYSDMQYSWRVAKKTLSIVVREVCNAMYKKYVDEVMTAPPHLKNGNNWEMVSSDVELW